MMYSNELGCFLRWTELPGAGEISFRLDGHLPGMLSRNVTLEGRFNEMPSILSPSFCESCKHKPQDGYCCMDVILTLAFRTKSGQLNEEIENMEKEVIQNPTVNYWQGRDMFSQLFSFLYFR